MADSSPPPPSASTRSSAAKAFKPRANVQRKAKTETEKFLAEEAERSKTRTNTPKTRGAKAGRGRGGASAAADKSNDKDSRLRGEVQSGGVFGAGSGEKQKRGQGRASSGGASELLDDEGRVVEQTPDEPGPATTATASEAKSKPKQTAKSKGKQKAAITDDVAVQGSADATVPVKTVPVAETVISDDDEPDEERRDIERIWLSSDEEQGEQQEDEYEDDVIDQKAKQKIVQRPRLGGGSGLRPVRAPRTVQPVDDGDEVSAKTIKHGKQPQRSKAQETIDVDEMDVDEVEFVKEVPSSPELRKKTISHKKASGKGKDVKYATETVEERAERLRVNEDINKLRHIFAPAQSDSKLGKRKLSDGQQDRLFLLQFPPITPFLIDPNASPPPADDDEVIEVKQEGTVANAAAQQTSVSTSKPTIKKDPDAPTKSTAQHRDGILTASSQQRLPAGLVGKLNVHASGKITLDWGGTDMEVRLGTEVGFLQDAVLVEHPISEGDDKMEGVEGDGAQKGMGTAYALGQVEGKMVVVPDFGKLYD